MTAPDFPRVSLPGGPYGFPPMLAESPTFDRARALQDEVDASIRTMVDDLRTQAIALGLELSDFEITLRQLDDDLDSNTVRFTAEAELRRRHP
jgi:hypothetical protein